MGARASTESFFDAGVVLDALPHGVALFDSHALTPRLLQANAEFLDITGYAFDELRSKPLWTLLAGPESDQIVQQQARAAFSGSPVPPIEWLIYRKDGSPLWVRVTAKGAHGRDTFLVTLEDISQYKQVRESLRASEGRLEVAIAANRLAMWDWNIPRDEIYYNEHWQAALDIDPKDLLAREELHERL